MKVTARPEVEVAARVAVPPTMTDGTGEKIMVWALSIAIVSGTTGAGKYSALPNWLAVTVHLELVVPTAKSVLPFSVQFVVGVTAKVTGRPARGLAEAR